MLSLNARKKSKKQNFKETSTPELLKHCQKARLTLQLRNKFYFAKPRKLRLKHLMKLIVRMRKLYRIS